MDNLVRAALVVSAAFLLATFAEIYFGDFQTCIRAMQEMSPQRPWSEVAFVCKTN